MITSILQGGFGNQLFQYAAAYSLAKETKQEIILDCSFYSHKSNTSTPRLYNLDKLNLYSHTIISDTRNFSKVQSIARIAQQFPIIARLLAPETIVENISKCRDFQFSLWEKAKNRNCTLYGFWQNTNYFKNYRNDLIKQFSPNYALSEQTRYWLTKVHDAPNSVGVHIRRGDFVKLGWNKGEEYYRKGMSIFRELYPNCEFYIVSDDPHWAICEYDGYAHIVDVNSKTKDIDEFFILSQCKHTLISESTFGWWAAYLNENKGKTIMVPREVKSEIFNKDWIRL